MKIVTAVVNNPDFIEMQWTTLKKFFKGEYEFIVFNDAKDFPDFTNGGDVGVKSRIESVCRNIDIQCINIPNDTHRTNTGASSRTADSMNYILNYQRENPDKYLLLDSDMFLIDHFDVSRYSNYDCAIVLQSRYDGRINYLWNGIYYFDMTKIKNNHMLDWNCSVGCDTGGMTQEWLLNQMGGCKMPNTDSIRWTDETFHTQNIYFIKHLWSCTWNKKELPDNLNNESLVSFLENDPRNVDGKYFCELYDGVFLHYRAGGNWRGEGVDLHSYLTRKLKQIL